MTATRVHLHTTSVHTVLAEIFWHCLPCAVEWRGDRATGGACWNCGEQGAEYLTPAVDGLPAMSSTRGHFFAASVPADETFRL